MSMHYKEYKFVSFLNGSRLRFSSNIVLMNDLMNKKIIFLILRIIILLL